MARQLWQDPFAASTVALMQDPARARAYAVEKIGEARARSQEIAGQALAAAQQQTGQATAHAQLQGGNAWAGAINQIGQTVASIPGQLQQQKMQGLHQQNIESEIANRKALENQRAAGQKANQAIDQIMQQSLKQDPTTGVYSFDRPTFEQGLVQSGNGHLYPELAETLDKLDVSASKRNAEARGMLADTLVAIGKSGYTPEAVFSGAAYLKANQVIKSDQLEPVLEAIGVDPTPENIKAVVARLGGALPEYGKRMEAEEKRAVDLAKTKAEADKVAADARVSAAEATNLEEFGRKEKPADTRETRSLDVQAADALAKGDTARYRQLLQAKRDLDIAGNNAAPTQPNFLWIIRGGKTLRVKETDIQPGDEPASTREQGRRVTSGDAARFAELQTSLDDISTLANVLGADATAKTGTADGKKTGAASGVGAGLWNAITEYAGWGEGAKERQAVIDRVRQVIGKALEGGVLRKEDEEKYKKILPTISDPPALAKSKLDGLKAAIELRLSREIDAREDAGYDVSKFRTRQDAAPAAPKPTNGPAIGERRLINGRMGEWDGQGWLAVTGGR